MFNWPKRLCCSYGMCQWLRRWPFLGRINSQGLTHIFTFFSAPPSGLVARAWDLFGTLNRSDLALPPSHNPPPAPLPPRGLSTNPTPSFGSPLWFDEEQMAELRGTPLATATATHTRMLRAQFQHLQPALTSMLRQVGVFKEPTFQDFLWAYSVFWSRGQSLPVPIREAAAAEEGEGGATTAAEGAGGGQRRQEGRGKEGVAVRVVVYEGIVPGLDFANHSTQVGGCLHLMWIWMAARVCTILLGVQWSPSQAELCATSQPPGFLQCIREGDAAALCLCITSCRLLCGQNSCSCSMSSSTGAGNRCYCAVVIWPSVFCLPLLVLSSSNCRQLAGGRWLRQSPHEAARAAAAATMT